MVMRKEKRERDAVRIQAGMMCLPFFMNPLFHLIRCFFLYSCSFISGQVSLPEHAQPQKPRCHHDTKRSITLYMYLYRVVQLQVGCAAVHASVLVGLCMSVEMVYCSWLSGVATGCACIVKRMTAPYHFAKLNATTTDTYALRVENRENGPMYGMFGFLGRRKLTPHMMVTHSMGIYSLCYTTKDYNS